MKCENSTCNRPDLKPVMEKVDGQLVQFKKLNLLFYYCPTCKRTYTEQEK